GFFGTSDVAGAVFMGGRMTSQIWHVKAIYLFRAYVARGTSQIWLYLIEFTRLLAMREATAKREGFVLACVVCDVDR
ncbi:hypothetical protein, partial [Ancylobacter lacus]|uniref:hypothetical protein n=1 Tax=Ancylobacter lacus TaxID=2579970 RepID=UPI001BCB816E